MTIYDISGARLSSDEEAPLVDRCTKMAAESFFQSGNEDKIGWRSALLVRLFFSLLLCGSIGWLLYSVAKLMVLVPLRLLSWGYWRWALRAQAAAWLSLKRGAVCMFSLFCALFSPAFGVMVGCAYFCMYDKKGMEEIMPDSIHRQFRSFFAE